MGQQQLLLIIAGVIIIGIAIGVGISIFGANSVASNKDAVTASLISIAADAYHFKLRPTTMGGGSGVYTNYVIQNKLKKDDNGIYLVASVGTSSVSVQGQSAVNTQWVATCTINDTGSTSFSYTGW